MAISGTGAVPTLSPSTQTTQTTTYYSSSPPSSYSSSSPIPSNPANKVDAPVKSALKLKKWKKIAFGGVTGTLIIGGAGLIAGGALSSNPLLVTAGIVCAAVGTLFLLIAAYAAYKNYKAQASANPPEVHTPPSTPSSANRSPQPFATPPPVQPAAPSPQTSTSTTTTITATTTTPTSVTLPISGTGVQNPSPITSPKASSSPIIPNERFDAPTSFTTIVCTAPVNYVMSTTTTTSSSSSSSSAPVSSLLVNVNPPIQTPQSPSLRPSGPRVTEEEEKKKYEEKEKYMDASDAAAMAVPSRKKVVNQRFKAAVIATMITRRTVNTLWLNPLERKPNNIKQNANTEVEAKAAEEDVKEADSRLVVSTATQNAALSIFVPQRTLYSRVWNVLGFYKKLSRSEILPRFENVLRELSPVLNHINRDVLLNLVAGYLFLKDQNFAVTKISRMVGLDGRVIEVIVNKAVGLLSYVVGAGCGSNSNAAGSSRDNDDSVGSVVAGVFELCAEKQDQRPDLVVQQFMQTHTLAIDVRENGPMVALADAYDKQSAIQQAAKQAQKASNLLVSTMTNAVSRFISTPSVSEEQAQKLAANLVNAMGSVISQTCVALQAQDKEANERFSATEEMLHAFFRGGNANQHPVVQAMVAKVTDLIADAIQNISSNVGMQHMEFSVGTQATSALIKWGSKECVELMKGSNPELFKMLEDIVENDAIKTAFANAKVAHGVSKKVFLVGHLWVYADHWQTVIKSLFDAEGNVSFNALLASEQANPRLAHAFSSICSIFSRGKSPEKYAGYLKSVMAAYELYNYASSADPVAFIKDVQETLKAEGFLDEEGQKLVESCNKGFIDFWNAEPNPNVAKLVKNFQEAMAKTKGVRIIMTPDAPRPFNDAFKDVAKRATDISGKDQAVAIGVDVAMNYGPDMVSNAAKAKVAVDEGDYGKAGVDILKFFLAGLMAAGEAGVQHKLYDEAGKAKDAAVDAAVDKIDFDSIVATLAAQGYTLFTEIARGMEAVGEFEEEQKIRVEYVDNQADVPPVAKKDGVPGADDLD